MNSVSIFLACYLALFASILALTINSLKILWEVQVIFADGTFIDGSTSELSCDGPLREPFAVYCQVCLMLLLAIALS